MLNILDQAKIISKENKENQNKINDILELIKKVEKNEMLLSDLYTNIKIILEI